jgi:ribosomal protein S6--L-glutamate ligase
MNLTILSHTEQSKLIETAKKRGHQTRVINPDDLYLFLSDAKGYDRIYEKGERVPLAEMDAIIPRIGRNLIPFGLAVVEHINKNMNVFSTSTADGLRVCADKFLTSQRLSQKRIKIPKTVMGYRPDNPEFLIEKVGGLPAIGKMLQGSQGKGVMILESKLAANTAIESLYKADADLLLQQYLAADSKDIRAIVVNGKVVVAMERTGNRGDFRANISKGGSGRKITLMPEEEQMAIDCADAVGLEFCGVDLMRANGTTYAIEINGNPGTRIIDITGVNYFEALLDYVEQNYKKPQKKADAITKAETFEYYMLPPDLD